MIDNPFPEYSPPNSPPPSPNCPSKQQRADKEELEAILASNLTPPLFEPKPLEGRVSPKPECESSIFLEALNKESVEQLIEDPNWDINLLKQIQSMQAPIIHRIDFTEFDTNKQIIIKKYISSVIRLANSCTNPAHIRKITQECNQIIQSIIEKILTDNNEIFTWIWLISQFAFRPTRCDISRCMLEICLQYEMPAPEKGKKTAFDYAIELFTPEHNDPFAIISLLLNGKCNPKYYSSLFTFISEKHGENISFEDIKGEVNVNPSIKKYGKDLFIITCCLLGGKKYESELLAYLSSNNEIDLSNESLREYSIAFTAFMSSCSVEVIKSLKSKGMKLIQFDSKGKNTLLNQALNYSIAFCIETPENIHKLEYIIRECKEQLNTTGSAGANPICSVLEFQQFYESKQVLALLRTMLDHGADPFAGLEIHGMLFYEAVSDFSSEKVSDHDDPWCVISYLLNFTNIELTGTDPSPICAALESIDCSLEHFNQLLDIIPWQEKWIISSESGICYCAQTEFLSIFLEKLKILKEKNSKLKITDKAQELIIDEVVCNEKPIQFLTKLSECGVSIDIKFEDCNETYLINTLTKNELNFTVDKMSHIVDSLLEAGAYIWQKNEVGENLLEVACKSKYTDSATLDVLSERGFRPISYIEPSQCLIWAAVAQGVCIATNEKGISKLNWLLEKGIEPCDRVLQCLSIFQDHYNSHRNYQMPQVYHLLDVHMREGKGKFGEKYIQALNSFTNLKANFMNHAVQIQRDNLRKLLDIQSENQESISDSKKLLAKLAKIMRTAKGLWQLESHGSYGTLCKIIDKTEREIQSHNIILSRFVKDVRRLAKKFKKQSKKKKTKTSILENIKKTSSARQTWLEGPHDELTGLNHININVIESVFQEFRSQLVAINKQAIDALLKEEETSPPGEIEKEWKLKRRILKEQWEIKVLYFKEAHKALNEINEVCKSDHEWITEQMKPYEEYVEKFIAETSVSGLKVSVEETDLNREVKTRIHELDEKMKAEIKGADDSDSILQTMYNWRLSRMGIRRMLNRKVGKLLIRVQKQEQSLLRILQSRFGSSSESPQPIKTEKRSAPTTPPQLEMDDSLSVDVSGNKIYDFINGIYEILDRIIKGGKAPPGTNLQDLVHLRKLILVADKIKRIEDFKTLLEYLGYELKPSNGGGHIQYSHPLFKKINGKNIHFTLDFSGTRKDPKVRRLNLVKCALLIVSKWEDSLKD